jgi:hypothetical protein
MSAEKIITLETSQGVSRDFGFQHALELLRLEKSLGKSNWKIKSNGYEFKEDEIIKRTDKRTSKEA